ncbi:MAG: amidohydrolase [Pirellulales bacterium]|nr:amidohydrolase [Pirellulales bacterium]
MLQVTCPVRTIVGPEADISVELLRHYLDEHGVERAVLVQPVYPGEDNSYVADAAAAEPDRFAAVCVVDPRQSAAAERLAYWCVERGCRGVRLRPKVPGKAACFGQPETSSLWDVAARQGIVVSVLCDFEHLPAVARMAERFPTVAIVIDHLAHPPRPDDLAGLAPLLELKRFPRVYVKISGFYYFSRAPYPYADCRDLPRAVYDSFGPARMIWGSDFPHVLLKSSYVGALATVERLCPWLTAAEREQILGRTADGLYWPKP